MKAEEQKILNDSLSKLFKIEPETLASLYNEAGDLINFSPILELDAERIGKYKKDSDSQFKRGIKEGASKIEKEVKEKYEFESEAVGIDLFDQVLVKKVEEAKTSGTKDITKHPDYIKLQTGVDKQLKDRDKEWQLKLDAREAEINKSQLFEKVSKKALTNLKSRNPILPQDPQKSQIWQDTYLNELKKGNYMEGDNGELIVLNAELKTLTNDHGKPIPFNEYVNEIADKYFEYPKSTERSSSANKETTPAGGQPPAGKLPKDEDERLDLLRDTKITAQRRKELTEYVIK